METSTGIEGGRVCHNGEGDVGYQIFASKHIF